MKEQANERDLITELRKRSSSLSPSLRSISDFILMEGTGLSDLSMQQLAQVTYTSKPTIVRLAQEFGFPGWREFRTAFLTSAAAYEEQASKGKHVDFNYPFGVQDQPQDIAQAIIQLHQATPALVLEELDCSELVRAARSILDARHVLFIGEAPNRYYGEIFSYNVSELGIDCEVPHNERLSQSVRHLGKEDCVIVASYSGDPSRRSIRHFHAAHESGATSIAITSEGSPLSHLCTHAFTFKPYEHYYSKIGGYYVCEAISCILDTLHAFCYAAHYEDNAHLRSEYAAIWQRRDHRSDNL